ncbi:MAG: hypothetical protein KDD44_05025 [Bdellovibrionales bacterium]|nr:hypothetical protein [Bdellovibrionales bacterium]
MAQLFRIHRDTKFTAGAKAVWQRAEVELKLHYPGTKVLSEAEAIRHLEAEGFEVQRTDGVYVIRSEEQGRAVVTLLGLYLCPAFWTTGARALGDWICAALPYRQPTPSHDEELLRRVCRALKRAARVRNEMTWIRLAEKMIRFPLIPLLSELCPESAKGWMLASERERLLSELQTALSRRS